MNCPVPGGQNYPNEPALQNVRVNPVQIEFVSRFFGGSRYIAICTVAFDPAGFSVEGKRFWALGPRLALIVPLALIALLPALLVGYFWARTHDRDYVRYEDVIKVKRKRWRYDMLARNSNGKKYWYCMKTPYHLQEMMQWVDQHHFPQD